MIGGLDWAPPLFNRGKSGGIEISSPPHFGLSVSPSFWYTKRVGGRTAFLLLLCRDSAAGSILFEGKLHMYAFKRHRTTTGSAT